jgi:nicotinamidase-related amidase
LRYHCRTTVSLALDLRSAALIVIDMQRDVIEPGRLGASLGNDVSRLAATCRPCVVLWAASAPVIHTKECHRSDLSDCRLAKCLRGDQSLRSSDAGSWGVS